MPEPSPNIVNTLRTAIDDYADFPTDELRSAVIDALAALDSDLTESGYQQSSRADAVAQRVEEQMNEADVAAHEEEAE